MGNRESGDLKQKIENALRHLSALHEKFVCPPYGKNQFATPSPYVQTQDLEGLRTAITEIQEAEIAQQAYQAKLAAECRKYQQVFETMPDGYFLTDVNGIIQAVNSSAEELLKCSEETLQGQSIAAFLVSQEEPQFQNYLRQLQDGILSRLDDWYVGVQPIGDSSFSARFSVMRITDPDNRLVNFVWLLRNVVCPRELEKTHQKPYSFLEQQVEERTDELRQTNHQLRQEIEHRKQVRAELQKSEARYRAIIEDNTELISRFTPDGTLTFVNSAYCRYFDKSPNELLGQSFLSFTPKEERNRITEHLASLNAQRPVANIEYKSISSAGETRWQRRTDRLIFNENNQIAEIQSVGRDITDRKLVELALVEERNLLRTLIDSLPDVIYVKNIESQFIIANRSVARMVGAELGDDLVNKTDFDFFPKKLASSYYGDDQVVVQTGYPLLSKEEPAISPLGDKRWLSTTKIPLRDQTGEIVGLVGIGRDITQHKQLEEALYQKTAELEAIFKTIPDAVLFTNTDRQIMKINPTFTTLFGYRIEDVFGRKSQIIYANPEDYEKEGHTRFYPDADEDLEPYEIMYRRGDGAVFVSESVGALVMDHGGRLLGYLSIMRDITERKQTELEKAQLFEAVSHQREQLRALTGRLAEAQEAERKALARELHDQVGQNLTALDLNLNIIYSRFINTGFDAQKVVFERLNDSLGLVNQTAERIRNVMVNLRPPLLDDYGLMAALRWYGEQFTSRAGFSVVVQGEEPDPRLQGPLEDTLFRITQEALTNVAKHSHAQQVTVHIETDNEFIRLQISDDGDGFDLGKWSDVKRRKNWGLITMIERAEAMGGYCQIESQHGQGTQVLVELPK
ncbi:MAG: PAS domain S-box protein [Anaerolineae bacterium]|nr:PAS domain S-box protein [Anaerolineae bacterium]